MLMKPARNLCLLLLLLASASLLGAQSKSVVVEEIVARVNNEIITTSDLARSRVALIDDVRADCRNCSPDQLQSAIAEKEKTLLRDLIDQALLVQRAKDVGISVETELVRRMDQIRQQNNLESMEKLEEELSKHGIVFEEWKDNLRKSLLSQQIIQRDVGSRVQIDREEITKFYDGHKEEFHRPEQVALREIFVSTDGKDEAGIAEAEKKAHNLLDRVKKGDDFIELAKRYSDGSTAQRGGELGIFERGQLDKALEDVVFKLDRGQLTDVIRSKTGFLFLKVEIRYEAGIQPLDKVEGEIQNRLYFEKIEPAMRKYLTTLREESYIVIKPGYTDTAAVPGIPIQEVEPGADNPDKEKESRGRRWYWPFGSGKSEKP